jgi:hypothetical protein
MLDLFSGAAHWQAAVRPCAPTRGAWLVGHAVAGGFVTRGRPLRVTGGRRRGGAATFGLGDPALWRARGGANAAGAAQPEGQARAKLRG